VKLKLISAAIAAAATVVFAGAPQGLADTLSRPSLQKLTQGLRNEKAGGSNCPTLRVKYRPSS
jgi:hypothetical protein